MGWFGKSAIALILLVPAWIAIHCYGERGVKGEVTALCYGAGCALGMALWIFAVPGNRALAENFAAHRMLVAVMVGIGALLGAAIQALVYTAINESPNPGLPISVANASAVAVFVLTPILAKVLPAYFKKAEWNAMTMTGVLLTVVGTALIAIYGRRS